MSVEIDPRDEPSIANTFTKLTERSDTRRQDFSKTLLIIYTPVSSGLVFLSTTLSLEGYFEKLSFLVMITTSVLIVLSALIERLGRFLTAETIGRSFTKHVRETGKHTQGPLYGKDWHNKLVSSQLYIMFFLCTGNILASMLFVYSRIL